MLDHFDMPKATGKYFGMERDILKDLSANVHLLLNALPCCEGHCGTLYALQDAKPMTWSTEGDLNSQVLRLR